MISKISFIIFLLTVTTSCSHSTTLDFVPIKGAEPLPAELAAIDSLLPSFIAEQPQTIHPSVKDLHDYKLQCMVKTGAQGQRQIYINGVCKDYWPEVKDGDRKFVVVLDGGACFFHVIYDPKTGRVLEFVVNGEA